MMRIHLSLIEATIIVANAALIIRLRKHIQKGLQKPDLTWIGEIKQKG